MGLSVFEGNLICAKSRTGSSISEMVVGTIILKPADIKLLALIEVDGFDDDDIRADAALEESLKMWMVSSF